MTPLHTPPVAPHHTSHAPLAPSQDYASVLQQWADNAPGEGRTQAAHRILQAYKTNSVDLDLVNCGYLTTLPALPAGLTGLTISFCQDLTNLPTGLTRLAMSFCPKLVALSNLPEGLSRLNISYCPGLVTLSNLPAGLTRLNIDHCRCLATLSNLPEGLTKLNINHCPSFATLSNLPEGLTQLNINSCPSFATLPTPLPAGLVQLVTDCPALRTLPAHLSTGLTLLAPLRQWCKRAGTSPTYVANLQHAWQQLKTTAREHVEPFESLIDSLAHPDLRNSVPPISVLEIIESVIQSPDIRHLIFEASVGASADCHDRRLTVFNTVQGLARFDTQRRERAAPQAILKLAIGMAKLALLDEVTPRVMQKQWEAQRRTGNTEETGPNMGEALEVQLALRHQLGLELDLPFLVNNPLYTGIAQLTDADRAFATAYVNDAVNNKNQLIDALVAQPIWRLHLEPTIPAETLSAIDDLYAERQDALDEQSANGYINEQAYINASDALSAERQVAFDAPFKQKTKTTLISLQIEEAKRINQDIIIQNTKLLKLLQTAAQLKSMKEERIESFMKEK